MFKGSVRRVVLVFALVASLALALGFGLGGAGCVRKRPVAEEPGSSSGSQPSASTGGSGALASTWRVVGQAPGTAPGLGLAPDTVPFAAIRPSSDGQPRQALLGYWDLDAGRVSFDDKAFCSLAADELRLVWDGGPLVGLATGTGAVPADTHPDLCFVALKSPGNFSSFSDRVALPAGFDGFLAMSTAVLGNGFVLEVHSWNASSATGTDVRTFGLTAPSADLTLNRAVDLRLSGGRVEAVFEATRPDMTTILIRAWLDGDRVRWDEPTKNLGIVEAGAGTRMARLGSRVYIGEQGNAILHADLDTGEVARDGVLTAMVEAFNAEHGRNAECPTPPGLFGYGDILIVEDMPADFSNPSAYLVAARGGEVLGEIVWAGGRLTVKKAGQVTMEQDLGAEFAPYWWFPQT